MNKREFETWFKQVYEAFGDFLDAYEEANPHWIHITLGQLIYGAAHSLKTYIENPDEGEITWDNPRVELQYDVDMDWERLSQHFFTLAQEDMDSQSGGSLEKTAEKLIKGFRKTKESFILRHMTHDIALLKQGDAYQPILPEERRELWEELQKLPGAERDPYLEELMRVEPLKLSWKGKAASVSTGGQRAFKATFTLQFAPLVIDPEKRRAYYPMLAILDSEGLQFAQWVEEDRREFWDRLLKELDDAIPEEKAPERPLLYPYEESCFQESPTFAMPSHPLMFTLLAMFAGKPERIPRKLLEKPYNERTPKERADADAFLASLFETETTTTMSEDGTGRMVEEEQQIALVADNPKVEAKAEISASLFREDLRFREGALAVYIKRAFGADGLRHLLGLLIGLEENQRQGYFGWSVNEHLERLGYKRKPGGAFGADLKRQAMTIAAIFGNLSITARRKDRKGEHISGKRLFTMVDWDIDLAPEGDVTKGKLTIRAEDFWYKNAFQPPDGQAPMYTKLLKRVAQENHRNHPLTIYLTPLLAIFWRMSPEQSFSVQKLMEWCNLDTQGPHRMYHLKDLETELEYMKIKGYLGGWANKGKRGLPSECRDPFKCVLTFTPPEWLQEEFARIEAKREQRLPKPQGGASRLTRDQFVQILQASGLSQKQFGNKLGISRQMVNYIKSGNRGISQEVSDKIRDVFGDILEG